jgi:hypothetical protein
MAPASLNSLGLFLSSGVLIPVDIQSDQEADGYLLSLTDAGSDSGSGYAQGPDQADIGELAQLLQQATEDIDGEGGDGIVPVGVVSDAACDEMPCCPPPAPGSPGPSCPGGIEDMPWEQIGISENEIDALLAELNEPDAGAASSASGPRVRRIDHLLALERRECMLGKLRDFIDYLETSGKRLISKAAELGTAGVYLRNGLTPTKLEERADKILEVSENRAAAREARAANLKEEAEELLEIGGRRNRIRARLKLRVASFLERTADVIRSKGEEKAEQLNKDASSLEHIMGKLHLSENSPISKRRLAGEELLERADQLKLIGERRLGRAEQLKELLEHLLEKMRNRMEDLLHPSPCLFDLEA